MGDAFFLFRKAKEPKKNRFCLSHEWLYIIFDIWGAVSFMREAACGYCFKFFYRLNLRASQRRKKVIAASHI